MVLPVEIENSLCDLLQTIQDIAYIVDSPVIRCPLWMDVKCSDSSNYSGHHSRDVIRRQHEAVQGELFPVRSLSKTDHGQCCPLRKKSSWRHRFLE
jgi:hypothetical protein